MSLPMLRALVGVVIGHRAGRGPVEVAIRDYRVAGRVLVAAHERRYAGVIRQLQDIPLDKTRREDAMRLVEYMPRLTAAGRRREAAREIWEMRRRYGSKEARRRLRMLAHARV